MKRHSYDGLEKEAHELVCRRVVMLEGLLERAIEIITEYAREAWISEAHEVFRAAAPDLSRDYAAEIWGAQIGNTTKDFGYPIPPDNASEAAQSDMSYWED